MEQTVVWLGVDDPDVRAQVRQAIGDAAFRRFEAIAGESDPPPQSGSLDARSRAALSRQIEDLRDDVETALEANDRSLVDDAIRSALAFVVIFDGEGSAARISHRF